MKIIGLMSGTSADGVDACLAEIREGDAADRPRMRCDIAAFVTVPYPDDVRRRVLDVRVAEDVCALNMELGELFAGAALEVCRRAGTTPADVDAVGSHGQTVCHMADRKPRATLQIGEPCIIAERTGITTVADFRPRDIAAGGSGAPLVPVVDFLLLADDAVDRTALNMGGIANVTMLPAGCTVDDVVAFDTGPGNMVIDTLMEMATDGRETYDRDGAAAARGEVCEELVDELLADPYFALDPPKSTGRERFGRAFAQELREAGASRGCTDDDIVATAAALTAQSIAKALSERSGELVVSGGGVHNATLMGMIRETLPGMNVLTSDARGIPADAKEAVAFAVLAYLTLKGQPGNIPGATGAAERAVLGKIVPGRDGTLLPVDAGL